jgi:hypothetical protein
MEGYEDFDEKLFVFCFERKRKPIDDTSQNFQELTNPIEMFRLIDKS